MAHYYPQPINQFNRLIHISGGVTGYYTMGSSWDSGWEGRNCTAAMGAVLIDADTRGATKSSPPQIRSHQNDWSGGIGWDDVNVAYQNLYGRKLEIPYGVTWADVIQFLKDRRVVGIQGDYDQVPYSYQCQKGGTFDHAFALGDYRSSDGALLYYDPLCRSAKWVPQYAIRAAAEKLALAQRGTKSRLFVMITRQLPSTTTTTTTTKYEAVVPAGNFWRFYVSGTSIIKPYRTSESTGGFTYACSAPARYYDVEDRLAADSYPLVRLNAPGKVKNGWLIDAKYARVV